MVTKTRGKALKDGGGRLRVPRLDEVLGDGSGQISRVAKLVRIKDQRITVQIKSISPLLMHAFPAKAQKEMNEAQARKAARRGRKAQPNLEPEPPRASPEEQFERAKYLLPDGRYGFPASGFKAALVDAGGLLGLVMKDLQKLLFVVGEDLEQLVPIEGTPEMDSRVGRANDIARTPILQYRPIFREWGATLTVEFPPNLIDAESVITLIDVAGHRIGIGDWRPASPRSKSGSFGRWEVKTGETH